MTETIDLGGIAVEVVKKKIKNIHLSVYPPNGMVRISAPVRMSLETIRIFALAKLGWIRQQQQKLLEQERETPREYLDRESHYVWGERCLLKVAELNAVPEVRLGHGTLLMRVRPGTDVTGRQAIVAAWQREQIRQAAPPLVAKWEPILGVKVTKLYVRHMRTKWGSCNPRAGSVRLNSELVRKPRECLEYVVVHEMVHLLEPTHNQRFKTLMERFMPTWRHHRENLNRLPVRHEQWVY